MKSRSLTYCSVHSSFLVFTNLLVIARHGYIAMTGCFFVSKDQVQHKGHSSWFFSAIRHALSAPELHETLSSGISFIVSSIVFKDFLHSNHLLN